MDIFTLFHIWIRKHTVILTETHFQLAVMVLAYER